MELFHYCVKRFLPMSESELTTGCITGNRQALKSLYEGYAKRMLSLCFRYTKDADTAHDLLHDGFLRVFSIISSFEYRGEGSLKAWLSRVFTNVCLEHLRKRDMLRDAVSLDEGLETEGAAEPDMSGLEMDVLMGFVMDLPTGYRTVFNLFVFEEWSHKEIAHELNIKEQSSSSQLARARKLLAKRIIAYRDGKF